MSSSDLPLFKHVRFPDGFHVCWAGAIDYLLEAPGTTICYGFEDGTIFVTDLDGKTVLPPRKGSRSAEAINGVTVVGDWLAVSTRQDVSLWPLPRTGINEGMICHHGAHGVTTTKSGHLIAPLGRTGILSARPPFSPTVTLHTDPKDDTYFYRTICLESRTYADVLVSAARAGGVFAGVFTDTSPSHTMTTASFEGLDVVDVCSLATANSPLAIAALGRDGGLALFQDVLRDKKPITMKFNTFEGVGYRILSCLGHIFVLTSKALYMLANLAARFTAGESLDGPTTPILVIPQEGVDASLRGDDILLVTMADEVRLFDVHLMHKDVPRGMAEIRQASAGLSEQRPTILGLPVRRLERESTSKQVAMAG